ncbi:hypothetical protein Rhe02_67320 [Rhizocola hellebori]|uniref:Uncharacterized protein n=1 Tax=Rhizocola hellebori TaxID=1392758 RepID=A0A8J3VJG5_9ACTN|nr:hypothetical protein [Rhizocola hellebori]GIH08665.1 hypothetical protein Rhe02_67320 [Rhizocola hellebori]
MQDMLLPELLVLALSVPLWMAWRVSGSPVYPSQVLAFSTRQRLAITVDNGNHVIAYLATTRRWRALGLAMGVVASVLTGLPAISINSLPLLAGWFAGALIAELRVLPPPSGPQRMAFVTRRKLSTYVSPPGRALFRVAAVLIVPIGLISPMRTLPWTVGALAVVALVLVIQRRVLDRPQPAGSPDLIAADDAIRSRSLNVLAGGGTALILFLVLGQLFKLGLDPVLAFVGYVLVAILGWAVATSRWLVLRAA